jgi:hypothetical protein
VALPPGFVIGETALNVIGASDVQSVTDALPAVDVAAVDGTTDPAPVDTPPAASEAPQQPAEAVSETPAPDVPAAAVSEETSNAVPSGTEPVASGGGAEGSAEDRSG